jgi:hypothetical protein
MPLDVGNEQIYFRHMRVAGAVALLNIVFLSHITAARADHLPVAVIALGAGDEYQPTTRVAIAIRSELQKRGWLVTNPAVVFDPPREPPRRLISNARKLFKKTLAKYDAMEFKEARSDFARTVTILRQVLKMGGSADTYIQAMHYLAAAALYDGDRRSALVHFSEAVSFSPHQEPSRGLFPPDLFEVFEEARAATVATGSLKIQCSPPAEVSLNREVVGTTPLVIKDLRPGHYFVRVRRAGYEADSQWIQVASGATAEVRTELPSLEQLEHFRTVMGEASSKLAAANPGAAVQRLQKLLSEDSVILVSLADDGIHAQWAEGNRWIKKYVGKVEQDGEASFASQFLAVPGLLAGQSGCMKNDECPAGKQCVKGACVKKEASTPLYKKWWFWTIVGTAVAGGTLGAVLGTRD